MVVLVPESVGEPAMRRLSARFEVRRDDDLWRDHARLLAAVAEADGLLVRNQTRVVREVFAAAPRLKVVGRHGAGLDNIDLAAAGEAGVVVTSTPEENAVSVAEHTFALMLAVSRRIVVADAAVRRGEWPRAAMTGFELHGKILGLLGVGRIGFRVALRARAFGMTVIGHDPYLPASSPLATESGVERLATVEEVLARADLVSVHLPMTDETRGLLSAERLALLKPGAVVINTSRGEIVDEPALLEALRSGRLAGAGLDVRAVEPPGADDPFAALASVVLTPHLAAFTVEAQDRVSETVALDIERVLTGGAALYWANFPRPLPGRDGG